MIESVIGCAAAGMLAPASNATATSQGIPKTRSMQSSRVALMNARALWLDLGRAHATLSAAPEWRKERGDAPFPSGRSRLPRFLSTGLKEMPQIGAHLQR